MTARTARTAKTARTGKTAIAARTTRPAPEQLPAPDARPAGPAPDAPSAPPARSARAVRILLPPQLALDETPRRAVTSINARHDDKVVFDQLQAWWSLQHGRTLSQWEAFTLLLAAALDGPPAALPDDVRRRLG